MSQKALVLHCDTRKATEVAVSIPQPSGEPGSIHPRDYSGLLPGADPDHLLVADCPFSHLVDAPVSIIYDASGQGEANPMASRLTTNVETGLQIEIKGDALAFYAVPGKDFDVEQWKQIDNVVYDELLEYFGQGLRPQPADIKRLVADYKKGRFIYVNDESMGDEDLNKDDGSLPGWG